MTKILVFESEPAFAWELRTELGRLGCTVQIVDDGNAGLQSAASDRPDLILLSIELPRMNGFSVCNKLKKDPQLKDVPLIIMSSDSSEETFEQHRRLKTRAEDYVRKPIALGELVGHIRQLVPIAAAIEPEAILIDEPVLFDDEIEDLGAPDEDSAAAPPKKGADDDQEIDDFLGGAFDRLMGDEEPQAVAPPKKQAPSLLPDPPTIPAPPPPAPLQAPVVLAPLPLPPPPPAARAAIPELKTPIRAPSVPPPAPSVPPPRVPSVPPPRSVPSKGPVTARSAPPPPSADATSQHPLSDAALIEHLRIELARSKEELTRNADEMTRLSTALDASRSNVQLLEARRDAEEVVRLKHQVEELKAKLAVAVVPPPPVGPSREFLDLRESLNKKDKEVLVLQEQLTAKSNEIVALQESSLALEREKSELENHCGELEQTCDEVRKMLDELSVDHEVLSMRAENFEGLTTKLEAKLMALDADAVAKVEAADTRARTQISALEEALAEEKSRHVEAHALLEQSRQALAEAHASLAERTAHVASLVDKHAAEVRALEQAHAEEVDAAHETEIAKLRQEHSEEITQLEAAHAAQLEALTKSAEERLAARNREFADEWVRGTADLEAAHAEALKNAERDGAERVRSEIVEHYENTLRVLESKHATEIEKMRAERDRAVEELDAASRSAVQELDRHVIALGADLQDTRIKLEETEEQRVLLNAEVVRLKDEKSAQSAHAERLENEIRALKDEVVSLGAEKDRFVAEAVASASRVSRIRSRWELDRLALERTREVLVQAAARLQEIENHPIDGE